MAEPDPSPSSGGGPPPVSQGGDNGQGRGFRRQGGSRYRFQRGGRGGYNSERTRDSGRGSGSTSGRGTNQVNTKVGASFDFVDRRAGGADVKRAILEGAITFTDPAAPADLATNKAAEIVWKIKLAGVEKRREQYRQNMASAYSTIIAICSESLQGTLENTAGFAQLRSTSDSLGLLEMIKRVMFTQKEKKHPALARTESRFAFVGLQQGDMSVQKYYDSFVQSMEVMRLCGGSLGITDDAARARLVTENNTNPTVDEVLDMMNTMEQEDYASMLIHGADNRRFALLKEELSNNFAMGMDNYPGTRADARTMLANRTDRAVQDMRRRGDRNGGESEVMLATDGDESVCRRRGMDNVVCYNCNQRGHIATNCPQRQGNTNVTNGSEGTSGNNVNSDTSANSGNNTNSGNVSSTGGAVQCLMDGIEMDEYDDVTCHYADLFVSDGIETDHAYEYGDAFVTLEADDEDLDIGICHNCNRQGWVGTMCSECEDQGCIFDHVHESDEAEVELLPPEQPPGGEFGRCESCHSLGPLGKGCYCTKGQYRSMYGRCTYCERDGPIGKPCISCVWRVSYYELVADANHGYSDMETKKSSEATSTTAKATMDTVDKKPSTGKFGISWNKKDPNDLTATIRTKKGIFTFDARTSKSSTVKPTSEKGGNNNNVIHGVINDGETSEGFVLLNHHGKLPEDWILLDNQSTVNVFANRKLLQNVRTTNRTMIIRCNAGLTKTNMIGELPGYSGEVWFYPDGIANILSYADMVKRNRVTYDNTKDDVFHVHRSDGSTCDFIPSARGLYYTQAKPLISTGTTLLIKTVAGNKELYTERMHKRAEEARKLQNMIGHPPVQRFLEIIDKRMLANCPVTREDIIVAEKIYGPNLGGLKGRTTRHASPTSDDIKITGVPAEILKAHGDVTLSIDLMFVNKIPFLITISKGIKFGSATHLQDKKKDTIKNALYRICDAYKGRGFKVILVKADHEFESLRADMTKIGVEMNITARDEHVPEAERYIRTLKERTRATYTMLPFPHLPGRMIVELIMAQNYWLNVFPASDGISAHMSPRCLLTGQDVDFNKHCKLEFGSYVQTHEEHDNSMVARTIGAIALRPTGNAQGSWFFLSLSSGQRISRTRWTDLPMPDHVINAVTRLARRSRSPNGLTFLWGDQNQPNYNPGHDGIAGVNLPTPNQDVHNLDDADDDEDDDDYDPDDDDDGSEDDEDDNGDDDNNNDGGVIANDTNEQTQPHDDADDDADDVDIHPHDETDDDESTGVGGPETDDNARVDDLSTEMDTKYGVRTHGRFMRTRRQRDYSHRFGPEHVLMNTVLTQYPVREGLKVFGEDGANAVLAEMKQLHDRDVMKPVDMRALTSEQRTALRKKALAYLMFLKKKRCGKIEARGCADGRKQRLYKTKEEVSSPTVRIESVMLSCLIDAVERRDVATADVPGAFMQADIDEDVYIRLSGPLARLLTKVDPGLYKQNVTMEGGVEVIYAKLSKALYGTLQAALLFWEELSGMLIKECGFTMNEYDECVVNKEINGKQCTVLWHVDDVKVSHDDDKVVDEILSSLNDRFGKDTELTVTRGKVHEYLGMTIDFSVEGKVRFWMDDYVDKILTESPEEWSGTTTSPCADHLNDVNEKADQLNKEKADFFHTTTAKLLFLSQRVRPELGVAVGFDNAGGESGCGRLEETGTSDHVFAEVPTLAFDVGGGKYLDS
jgi:Reverse transcriptase (RNA-dependent DNA polymerase)/Zinc knuckle